LSTVNYNTIALNHTIIGAVPAKIVSAIPDPLPFPTPANIAILRRCTLPISDPAQNYRLPHLASTYDILALRPTTEKAFLAACTSMSEHSIISLDLTQRYPFHFRPKPLLTAIKRGIRFELCYAQAVQGDSAARRNVISNILSIIRATSGRGLIISSEAKSVLGVRAPADVGNLMMVWGLSNERATEAVTVEPRSVVVNERIKRTGFRGVVDVVDGGVRDTNTVKNSTENGERSNQATAKEGKNAKRKNGEGEKDEGAPQISKRMAKKIRLEVMKAETGFCSASASPSKQIPDSLQVDTDTTNS
jgi:ribonuclease P/MRP protein subunit RPP1